MSKDLVHLPSSPTELFNRNAVANLPNYRYLTDHYESLYYSSVEKLRDIVSKQFSPSCIEDGLTATASSTSYYDPILQDQTSIEADARYGITLIIRPPPHLFTPIQSFLSVLRSVVPDQYFYPNEDLHMTLLSVIPCHVPFSLRQINVPDYVETIDSVLNSPSLFNVVSNHNTASSAERVKKRVHIQLKGITASTSCVMIQGFVIEEPACNSDISQVSILDAYSATSVGAEVSHGSNDDGGNDDSLGSNTRNVINDLRDSLRSTFQHNRPDLLLQPIDLRYTLTTAHFTVARLSRPFSSLKQAHAYLDVLESYRNVDFGTFVVDTVDLVGNDWYMSNSKVALLHRFDIC